MVPRAQTQKASEGWHRRPEPVAIATRDILLPGNTSEDHRHER